MDSPFVNQPPIVIADFAFAIIFAVIYFGQLVFVLFLIGIKMNRKPWGDTFGSVTEQESRLLRYHRARFALLMIPMLVSLIIMYSLLAVLNLYNSTFLPFLNIDTAYTFFGDIQNAFFFAVSIVVLDSGIKVSRLRRYSSIVNAMQGGTDVNIIVMSCLVGFLIILVIARTAVVGEWRAEETIIGPSTTTVAEQWAQFGLAQVRNFISLILTIYYIVVGIVMWRKKHIMMVPRAEPNEADKNYSFRVLSRIARIVCPSLLLSTVYMIISDVLGNTIVTGDNYLSFLFADDFITGVIIILLNFAIISVGYVL